MNKFDLFCYRMSEWKLSIIELGSLINFPLISCSCNFGFFTNTHVFFCISRGNRFLLASVINHTALPQRMCLYLSCQPAAK